MSSVELKKTSMSNVSVGFKNVHVACHYDFKASYRVANISCRMSNLRKGHVAMLNLLVQTHTNEALCSFQSRHARSVS